MSIRTFKVLLVGVSCALCLSANAMVVHMGTIASRFESIIAKKSNNDRDTSDDGACRAEYASMIGQNVRVNYTIVTGSFIGIANQFAHLILPTAQTDMQAEGLSDSYSFHVEGLPVAHLDSAGFQLSHDFGSGYIDVIAKLKHALGVNCIISTNVGDTVMLSHP